MTSVETVAVALDIWDISLNQSVEHAAYLAGLLNPSEQERAARYLQPLHQRRFQITRGALRMILAEYLQVAPHAVGFRYQALGRPELQPVEGRREWDFNLSHSGDRAILAVSLFGPVGIDIEQLRERDSLAELARRYFALAEIKVWESLPEDKKTPGFYSVWTRKEAYLKARGSGLTYPLDRFVVSADPREPAALISVDDDPGEAARWQMHDLTTDSQYAAAVIHPAGNVVIRRRTFTLYA